MEYFYRSLSLSRIVVVRGGRGVLGWRVALVCAACKRCNRNPRCYQLVSLAAPGSVFIDRRLSLRTIARAWA